jgi:hypothetical protein
VEADQAAETILRANLSHNQKRPSSPGNRAPRFEFERRIGCDAAALTLTAGMRQSTFGGHDHELVVSQP